MKCVLVTGAAGFIGVNLIRKLQENENIYVVGIDNFLMAEAVGERGVRSSNRYDFYNVDVSNAVAMSDVFEKYRFDRVYHLAANSDISISYIDPSVDFRNTFYSTWVLLECMRKFSCKELIFASSSAIFGDVNVLEVQENYGPCYPISHYGASKLGAEAFISSYAFNYQISSLVLRFPNVIGDFVTHGVIFDLFRKAQSEDKNLVVLGDGKQEKSYLHVVDLLSAFEFAWNSKSEIVSTFNIGNRDTITVASIAEIIRDRCCAQKDIVFTGGQRAWKGDVPNFKFQTNKLFNTGWSPRYSSQEAVEKTIDFLLGSL